MNEQRSSIHTTEAGHLFLSYNLLVAPRPFPHLNSMFSLWNFFKSILLLVNALAILHEKRFLRKCTSLSVEVIGLDRWDVVDTSYGASTVKNQCIGLLQAVRWLRCKVESVSSFS